jgi:acetyl-CoA acetyltransferase
MQGDEQFRRESGAPAAIDSSSAMHPDPGLNAMVDAGLKHSDIEGIATAGETPVTVAYYLGLTPKWVDGTAVGGCSFMIHVRHAAAAIASGLCVQRRC